MVAFGRWEAEPDTLSGFPQVRMKCSKERWVRRDMVVPRSLLELTHLYEAVTSHYAWADVGKDDRFGRSVRWCGAAGSAGQGLEIDARIAFQRVVK